MNAAYRTDLEHPCVLPPFLCTGPHPSSDSSARLPTADTVKEPLTVPTTSASTLGASIPLAAGATCASATGPADGFFDDAGSTGGDPMPDPFIGCCVLGLVLAVIVFLLIARVA